MYRYLILTILFFIQCTTIQQAHSENSPFASGVSLQPLFSNHMVLQRNKTIPIWGKAESAGKIIIKIKDTIVQTRVDSSGHWKAELPPMKAGGPYSLTVTSNNILSLTDIYVGDVWLCSGQSNMQWPLSHALNAVKEVAQASYPLIRLLTIEQSLASRGQSDFLSKGWKICSPETASTFSAVAYFFGREIYNSQNIPIGLIQSSWRGTAIQSWMSGSSLKKFPEYYDQIQRLESQDIQYKNIEEINKRWQAELPGKDIGSNTPSPWFTPTFNDTDWRQIELPAHWERSGETPLLGYDGVVWFKRNFTLPFFWRTRDTVLSLGPIDDADSTWINGHLVGSGNVWDEPRNYIIPKSVLRRGKNQLTVQVLDTASLGGIWASNPEELKLTNKRGKSIPLAGNWKYKIGIPADQMPPHADINTPSMIYNAMIQPLVPYSIQGIIWYQGEANTWEASRYRTLFPAMIEDWRKQWKQNDLPFYFVQLANYQQPHPVPRENNWAELREHQLTALSIPYSGMAVAIDIGNANTIHPPNKQDVGKRLALIARNNVYNETIPYSGPIYSSMQIEMNQIRLFFDHAESGLKTQNGDLLEGFAIAGNDHKFLWANAEIEDKTVVVSHPLIKHPQAVRYAWDSNPACNLYNNDNLPASPFRTDGSAEMKTIQ